MSDIMREEQDINMRTALPPDTHATGIEIAKRLRLTWSELIQALLEDPERAGEIASAWRERTEAQSE